MIGIGTKDSSGEAAGNALWPWFDPFVPEQESGENAQQSRQPRASYSRVLRDHHGHTISCPEVLLSR